MVKNQQSNDTYTITFQDGTEVDFHGQPSNDDIQYVAQQIDLSKEKETNRSIVNPGLAIGFDIGIARGQEINNQPVTFPVGNTPFERNVIDPALMYGTEIARAYNRGGAAAMTPLAVAGKVLQVPPNLNFPEQVRKELDKRANQFPTTSLSPAVKEALNLVFQAPGQMAAVEQVSPVIAPAIEGLQAILNPVGRGLKSVGNTVGEMFSAGRKIKDVEKNIAGIEDQLGSVGKEISSQPEFAFNQGQKIKELKFKKTNDIGAMTQEFKSFNQNLENVLNKDSLLQSRSNKEILRNTFKDMSKTYKEGLGKAEEAMAARGEVITSEVYGKTVLGNVKQGLIEDGIPQDSPILQKVFELEKEFNNKFVGKNLDLSDMKNIRNEIYDKLSSGFKQGTHWATQEDYVGGQFLKAHGKFLENYSPEIKQLNQEFSPMANARKWAMKTFKPYNESEIQKGADTLRQIAISERPNQTTLNYLKQLEEGSGRFEGAGNLRGNVETTGVKIKNLKESFNIAKQNLISSIDFKINQIEQQIAQSKGLKYELGFKRDLLKENISGQKDEISRLEKLRTTRNWLVGLTIGGTVIGGKIKKAVDVISALQGD